MVFEYSQWDHKLAQQLLKQQGLMSLFNFLLVKTSGDVEKALEMLERLSEEMGLFNPEDIERLKKELLDQEIVRDAGGTLKLTSKGEQQIRESALDMIFSSLKSDVAGFHSIPNEGVGMDTLAESRAYEFGDSFEKIDFQTSLNNSFKRNGLGEFSLTENDLAVYETEHITSCATVIMVDISHSMILYGEDRITPAKNVALAMSGLIKRKYPKDSLNVIVFGDEAVEIPLEKLPYITVGPYHTNTKAGLEMASEILRKKKNVNKQIFMITDGKPSCVTLGGRLYKNPFGLDPRIVNMTLNEAADCKRKKITISTFMVAQDPHLVQFVEELTEINRGRAYYSNLDNLGKYMLVDFIKNRRKRFS